MPKLYKVKRVLTTDLPKFYYVKKTKRIKQKALTYVTHSLVYSVNITILFFFGNTLTDFLFNKCSTNNKKR